MTSAQQDRSMSWKGVVGIAGCVIGLAVVYFGYGIGTEGPKKDAAAEAGPLTQVAGKRPVRAMNMALGNMVYFARDLGFSVRNTSGSEVDGTKIAARIESQLHSLRELYRQEIATKQTLAGSTVLQFRIAPSGEVSHVRESGGRMFDTEFKKLVALQAGAWSFAEIVSENLEVTCPLLFVHEGMDITTLIQWEKSLASDWVQTAVVQPANSDTRLLPKAPSAAISAVRSPKSDQKEFQIKYAASLRKDPNFSAPTLLTLTIGTKVSVLGRQGDWLEVRSRSDGPVGFIRKEFVTPLEIARQ